MTTDELRGLLEILIDNGSNHSLKKKAETKQQIVAAFEELLHVNYLQETAFDSICHILGITEKSSRDEIESAIYKLKDALDIEMKRVKIHHDDWQRYKAVAERFGEIIDSNNEIWRINIDKVDKLQQQLADANKQLAERDRKIEELKRQRKQPNTNIEEHNGSCIGITWRKETHARCQCRCHE